MTTLKITLNKEQETALKEHAAKKGRTLEEDLLLTWWGRVQALMNYQEKLTQKNATFREYHPRTDRAPSKKRATKKETFAAAKEKETTKFLAAAKHAALKPQAPKLVEIRILPDDSPEAACIKAEKLAERDGYATEAEILKKFGRDTRGKKVSK